MSLSFPRFNMFLLLKMSMSIAITFANHSFQGGGALRANGGCPGCCKSDRHGGPPCWYKVRLSSFPATPQNCHVHHFQLWFLVNFWSSFHVHHRGERIIRYSNIIRITNIRIRIRPQIETQILFVFVFVQKFWSEYFSYSYSAKNLGMNIIRIRIRPKIWSEYYPYLYSFLFENTNIIRLSIRPPIYRTGVNKKPFSWYNPTSLEFNPDRPAEIGVGDCYGTRGLSKH